MRSAVMLGVMVGAAVVMVGVGLTSLRKPTPDAGRPSGERVWNPSQDARSAELTAETRAVELRIMAKHAIAAGLLRGDFTIDQAASRIRGLLAEEPIVLARLRDQFPNTSDEELSLRQLITFVRLEAAPDSARAAAVLRELDQQLTLRGEGTGPTSKRPQFTSWVPAI